MDLIKRASQRIAERLTWCIAHRDQAGMAKDLAEGKGPQKVGRYKSALRTLQRRSDLISDRSNADVLKRLETSAVRHPHTHSFGREVNKDRPSELNDNPDSTLRDFDTQGRRGKMARKSILLFPRTG
jgi:hypothetical protein